MASIAAVSGEIPRVNEEPQVQSFEFKYDREVERFRFSVRFENRNSVNERLDEELAEYIAQDDALYLHGAHIKSNTTILLRAELTAETQSFLAGYVDASLEAVRAVVDQAYPDAAYRAMPTPDADQDHDSARNEPSQDDR